MLPVLLDLRVVKIYTFGIFLVLAMFWGLFVLWRNVKLTSYKEEDVFDTVFIALVGAVFTARLFYVFANPSKFGFDVLKFILINGYPGLSLIGALVGGVLFGSLSLWRKKINSRHLVDYIISPLFLGMCIAKFGSFLAGVDVGSKTQLPIAVRYLGYSGNRHIVAFYESFLFLIAVYLAHRLLLQVRRHTLPEGFVAVFFIFFFSGVTLLLDKLKENHLYLVGFNLNVVISSVALALSGAYFLYYFRNIIKEYASKIVKNSTKAITSKTRRSREDDPREN